MWYVIQVFTGEEEKIVTECRKLIGFGSPSPLQYAFLPYALRRKKFRGEWHDMKERLFPGYVFLVSDDPQALYLALKRVPGLTRLLGTGRDIVPLSPQEEAFLRRMGGDSHVVDLSTGIIVDDRVTVTDGPLQGLEGLIKKIDRHKRTARLSVSMMGRDLDVLVGLEIVEKITS